MSNYTPEQLKEVYRKLPQSVQDAIFSIDTAEIIREIGEKYKLMIDKTGELADETGLVMLGFTHPKDYIPHLAERLGVDKEVAKEIGEEINSKVFFPIRENLKKIHGIEAEMPETETPKPQPETEAPKEAAPGVEKLQAPSVGEIPPPPAPTSPISNVKPPPPDIFEAKTKPEIFRRPIQTVEKETPTPPKTSVKIDPYREPTL